MPQIETGIPTPEPFLVGFLDLKVGEKINLKLSLNKVPGKEKPVRFVEVYKKTWEEQGTLLMIVTPERIEETREWLIAQDPKQGEEMRRLYFVNQNFLKVLAKFDPSK